MERLSIEEVIAHCKRHVEREERRTSAVELATGDMEPVVMKEYWEHRQVAEWLAELKEYRSLGTPEQLREIDKLYLEKCEEVNQLKKQVNNLNAMLAAAIGAALDAGMEAAGNE